MRILILNWRDIKNPRSGGAEILTHEIAKKWVEWGHSVTQVSSGFLNSKKEEKIDGLKIIRLGKWWSVHFLALFYYVKNLRGGVDVIIDEVHGIPFFSAVYAPKKTVLLACEVADKLFFEVFSPPIAYLGVKIERFYLKTYKKTPVLAISPSTRSDLIKRGFPKKNITVLPMGINIPSGVKKLSKEKKPTLIFLSRVNKRKGIEDVIEAFKITKEDISECQLWIVGTGEASYLEKIKKTIKKNRLTNSIKFFGFVSDKRKLELLSRAHILVFPSIHEGWGLVIAEAGMMGTPSVVYRSAGVIDVIKNGERGIMVEKNHPDFLASEIINLLKNDKLYKRLLEKVKSFEKEVGWDKTAKTALKLILQYENRKN